MCMLSWQSHYRHHTDGGPDALLAPKITQQAAKYFIAQQRDLGKVNGYIEEMMEGQKSSRSSPTSRKPSELPRAERQAWTQRQKQANSFANIMMPVNAQLGNISHAICALGAAMAVTGMGGVILGTVSGVPVPEQELQYAHQSGVSMQANSIIMALAGAERIFKMMDEPSETDEGYVTSHQRQVRQGRQPRGGQRAHRHLGLGTPTTTAPPPTTS